MKISSAFFAILAISILLFTIAPINACEQSCRTGISLAFGENYAKEVHNLFEKFTADLQKNTLDGAGDVSSTTKSEVNKVIDVEVDKFEKSFTGSFAKLIETSIFDQSPQFKGQCQHPFRVNQPPPGVAWTMEDCKNQDYICGNPPAICHFMDEYVKPRNVKNVKKQLTGLLSTTGSFFKTLFKAVIAKSGKLNNDTIKNNLEKQFNSFISYFNEEFCKGTSCDKYDHDIKVKLLSYP